MSAISDCKTGVKEFPTKSSGVVAIILTLYRKATEVSKSTQPFINEGRTGNP